MQNEYSNPYLTPKLLEAAREGAREQERRKDDPLLALIDKVKAERPDDLSWQDALDRLDSLLPDPPVEE